MKPSTSSLPIGLWTGVLLVNLFIYVFLAIALYESLQHYKLQAVLTTQNLARPLAVNVSGVLNKIDTGLFAVMNEVLRQKTSGGINDDSLDKYLEGQRTQLVDLQALWVADAKGDVRWGIGANRANPFNIASREYFQRLRDDPNAGLVLSKPLIGQLSKTWAVLIGRSISNADGSFGGVAFGSLRVVDYFTDMFSAIDVGQGGAIALRDSEMALLVRYPQVAGEGGKIGFKSVSSTTLEAIRTNPISGSYTTVAAPDNIKRTYSYQKVGGYPLYVFVGQESKESLSAWRKELAISMVLAGFFTLLSILYTKLSYRRTTELLAAQALELQRDELELEIKERTRELAEAKKAAEDGLQNERILMSAIVESSDDAIVGMTLDGAVTTWNRGAEMTFGYTSKEMIGQSIRTIVSPADQDHEEKVLAAIKYNKLVENYETKGIRKDRSPIDISVTGSPIHNSQGQLVGASIIARDISARVRSEERARQYLIKLKATFMGTVELAMTMGEMRDPYTAGHERRVAEIAVAIGAELGLDANRLDGLRVAGFLHDIGKITIPSDILSKPGRLSAIEYRLIQTHPKASYDVLSKVEFPWPVAQIALQHHERIDGSGYPQGIKGDSILLEARILAVADVIEAMSSHRPYRPGLGIDKALAEIERGRGTAYDTVVVDASLKLIRDKGYAIPA